MTTKVVISACHATEKRVEVVISDHGKTVKEFNVPPGQTQTHYVHDELEISVKEVIIESEIRLE